jgi:hypothetical protein
MNHDDLVSVTTRILIMVNKCLMTMNNDDHTNKFEFTTWEIPIKDIFNQLTFIFCLLDSLLDCSEKVFTL